MNHVLDLTDAQFDTAVKGAKVPVLIDFSATWCQPCKALTPTIEAIATEYQGRLTVYKVDIDHAQEAAAGFGILGVPTCVFLKNGREVDRFTGVPDLRAVRDRVEKVLA